MTAQSQDTKPSHEELLEEYKAALTSAHKMEDVAWQTSAAVGLGLVATMTLTVARGPAEQPTQLVAILLGSFTTALTIVWFIMARRWWTIQHAMLLRMRHIERELGFHANRYVSYLDALRECDSSPLDRSALDDSFKDEIRERARKRFLLVFKDHQRTGPQPVLAFIPLLNAAFWALYIILR